MEFHPLQLKYSDLTNGVIIILLKSWIKGTVLVSWKKGGPKDVNVN